MKRKHVVVGLVACLVVDLVVLAALVREPSPPPFTGPLRPASELTRTDILPHMEGEIVPGRNYVYCGTFQLAWNEMQDEIIKEPIRLEGDPPMAQALNRQAFRESDISPGSYLAMAGAVRDGIVGEIRRRLAAEFPSATLEVPDCQDERAIYAYGYLQKTLPFPVAFDDLGKKLEFHSADGDVRVSCFGIEDFPYTCRRDKLLQEQVIIREYTNDDDFIVRLETTSEADELFLAKTRPAETLRQTVADVQSRISESPQDDYGRRLQPTEWLVVPKVSLNVDRRYQELLGRYLQDPGWETWFVLQACQGLRFRLDERGARVESGATFAIAGVGERRLIFDRPFLLYLKERDSDVPYFAMWIENEEVLDTSGR